METSSLKTLTTHCSPLNPIPQSLLHNSNKTLAAAFHAPDHISCRPYCLPPSSIPALIGSFYPSPQFQKTIPARKTGGLLSDLLFSLCSLRCNPSSHPQLCIRRAMAASLTSLLLFSVDCTELPLLMFFPPFIALSQTPIPADTPYYPKGCSFQESKLARGRPHLSYGS